MSVRRRHPLDVSLARLVSKRYFLSDIRGESTMTERLARLADRRAKRVVAVALVLFAVAGGLGAGVAQRLDPFGADDPGTESVIAGERLQEAGYRETGVIVLLRGTDPQEPAGRERVAVIAR